MRRRGGFTLIELLVVVVVIALLMAILLPRSFAGPWHGTPDRMRGQSAAVGRSDASVFGIQRRPFLALLHRYEGTARQAVVVWV